MSQMDLSNIVSTAQLTMDNLQLNKNISSRLKIYTPEFIATNQEKRTNSISVLI